MNAAPVTLELPDGIVRLVPMTTDHAEALWAILDADLELWRYMTVPRPDSLQATRTWILEALEAQRAGHEVPFSVIDRRTNRVVGSTRYMDIQRQNRSLEIGFTFYERASRRTAVNTECKLLLLRHAFGELGAVRAQLKCDARNEPSRAAIARLGASFEGILRKHRVLPDGFVRDTVYYSIIHTEWPDIQRRLEARLRHYPR